MTKEIEPLERYDIMHKIITLHNAGHQPTSIAKQLSMRRVDVLAYVEEYRELVINDPALKERAREALHNYDMQTSEVIKRFWEVVEEIDANGGLASVKEKTAALKAINDADRSRVDTLQKAGLYDDAALGDELVKTQEQAEEIKQLLTAVVQQYPEAKNMILSGLSKIFGESVGAEQPPLQGTIVTPSKEDEAP